MKRLVSRLYLMDRRVPQSTEIDNPDVDPRMVPALSRRTRRIHDARHRIAPDSAALLVARLQTCIDRAVEADAPVALLLVSAEFRRSTGQAMPPAAEEPLLHALVDTLKTWLLSTDVLVEAGNRTIAVILPGANAIGAEGVAHMVLRRLRAIHTLAGRDARVRARIGIAMFPDEDTDPEALIHRALARTGVARKGGAADPRDVFDR